MKHLHYITLTLILGISSLGCSDFLVEDISDETIQLNAPVDGIITSASEITFWWDTIEWVDNYELQIVSPSFDNAVSLVLNEDVEGGTLDVTIGEGLYEWRIIASNSAYEIISDTFSLEVFQDSTTSDIDISSEILNLNSPTNNANIEDANITFWWDTIQGADNYELQIVTPSFAATQSLVLNETLTENIYDTTLPTGTYQWRVVASNDISSTESTVFNLVVDADTITSNIDISNEMVNLNSPVNNTITEDTDFTFWWDVVQGADDYKLQIVTPSFAATQSLVLNETLTENTYDTTLSTGTYQWRVVANNDISSAESVIFDLEIEEGVIETDISNKSLILISPSNNEMTNTNSFNFQWQTLSGADEYRFQIAEPDFTNTSSIIKDITTTLNSHTETLPEGTYTWRVQGVNTSSSSPWTERQLTIDNTSPNIPTNLSPSIGDTLTFPINLTWTSDTESVEDFIYIYSDAAMSNIVLSTSSTFNAYIWTGGTSPTDTTYYWQVKSLDAVENESVLSPLEVFYVD